MANNSTAVKADQRLTLLVGWLDQQLGKGQYDWQALPGDASFRRYFRVAQPAQSYIAMDSPPDREPCDTFIQIAQTFYEQGLPVPKLYAHDLAQGLVLLEDFGDRLYLQVLNRDNADHLYGAAQTALLTLQQMPRSVGYSFEDYDRKELLDEMLLGYEWYFQKFLQTRMSRVTEKLFEQLFDQLIGYALQQPQVCVHRDYHSCNMMVRPDGQIGIIDFQDAVWGPITYDFVSLVRDCYIDWPEAQVMQWLRGYYDSLIAGRLISNVSFDQFTFWFDSMGLQRHIKCLGIFSRLQLAYGKPKYIQFLPRTINYLRQVSDRYTEFKEFNLFMDDHV